MKSLRVTTDILGQTTFVSLYQAGEGIYNLADKVLVIDQGRSVYYGPAKDARSYFVNLGFVDRPRQATADYLTACTDPNERQAQPGANPPSSPAEIETAYRSSKYFKLAQDDRTEYQRRLRDEAKHEQDDFKQAVLDAKKKDVSTKNPYTLGFVGQVKILTARQFRLQIQDRFHLMTSYGISLVSMARHVQCAYLTNSSPSYLLS